MQRSRTRVLGWMPDPDDPAQQVPERDPDDVSVVTHHAYDSMNRLVKTCVEGIAAPGYDMDSLNWQPGCTVSRTNVERGVS